MFLTLVILLRFVLIFTIYLSIYINYLHNCKFNLISNFIFWYYSCKRDHLTKLIALNHKEKDGGVRSIAKKQVEQEEKIKKLKKQVYKFEETCKYILGGLFTN